MKKSKSIRWQITGAFLGFLVLALGLIIFLNMTFMEQYYLENKKEILKTSYETIAKEYDAVDKTDTLKFASTNNLSFVIIDWNGSEPEGYSHEKVEKIADEYKVTTGKNKNLKQKPNIVVIMNETFSDLNVVNKIKTNKEVMPYINSLTDNTIKGNMLVSVFGGGTSNSEYEFLTGNSVSTLPLNGNAYTQFVKHNVPSLATQLKEQGYEFKIFP